MNKRTFPLNLFLLPAILALVVLGAALTAGADTADYALNGDVLTVYSMPEGQSASDYHWYPLRNNVKK